MSNYLYEAIDASGSRSHGTLAVADQSEALRRIREMGLFPIKVWQGLVGKQVAFKTGCQTGLHFFFQIDLDVLGFA